MWIVNSFSDWTVEAYEIRTMLNHYPEWQYVMPKPYYNIKDIGLYRTLFEFLSTFNKIDTLTIGLNYYYYIIIYYIIFLYYYIIIYYIYWLKLKFC